MNNFTRNRSFEDSSLKPGIVVLTKSRLNDYEDSSTGHSDQEISRSGSPYSKYNSIIAKRGYLYYFASFNYLRKYESI